MGGSRTRIRLGFVVLAGLLLLALAVSFVIAPLAARLADRCEIPYRGFESVGPCPGNFAYPKPLSADGTTWEIVVASKDPKLIAGALGRFWAERGGRAITVFARGTSGTSGVVGYDRGVLFDRNGMLTFGICTAWRNFSSRIGEVCNDQLRFDVRAGPTPSMATSPPRPATTVAETPGKGQAFLTGAGDIASCTSQGDEATAAILRQVGGTVFTAGDNAYESGTAGQYQSCYGPSWGRFKDRTHPAVGNHEYATPMAAGYFAYFGAAAGPAGKGYYSFALNGWRVFVLNSNCDAVGGCGAGSAQEQWLVAELARYPTRCSLAIWHHPRWSSGLQGSTAEMQAMWEDLYSAGTELLVVGHDHVYERFAPLDAAGLPDRKRGIREFVVGTGGASHETFRTPLPSSEVRNADTFGVLRLTLAPDAYQWEFLAEAGATFTDSGSGTCHSI